MEAADSLYYIMDYSSNYYRTDSDDQLVAATCKDEAAVFTFAQANSRISGGKKSGFYFMTPVEETEANTSVSPVQELTYEEMQEPTYKNTTSYDLSEIDWAEYLTQFAYIASGIKNYRDELSKKHSEIEQKICDILHYIELCEINDEEAVDLIELLRVCRENRRDVKDEIFRTEIFQKNIGTSANVAKAKEAIKCLKGLETRKYTPRKYAELFENAVMKEKELHRRGGARGSAQNEQTQPDMADEDMENTRKGGEGTMIGERHETPFDGKENNWMEFARQQAEFYRNAEQYITNLQLDIAEIDREIEDTLEAAEALNCNVAQGYKIFKKLKDLRVERRVKEKELNCLYTLTDYTDCAAMAEACEYNLAEIKRIMEVEEVEKECAGAQEADIVREEGEEIVQEQVQGDVEVEEMEDEVDMMQEMAG